MELDPAAAVRVRSAHISIYFGEHSSPPCANTGSFVYYTPPVLRARAKECLSTLHHTDAAPRGTTIVAAIPLKFSGATLALRGDGTINRSRLVLGTQPRTNVSLT